MLLSSLTITVPLVTGNGMYISLLFLSMGATIIMFPYVTPETNYWRGVKRGKLIGRLMGLVFVIISILILLLA